MTSARPRKDRIRWSQGYLCSYLFSSVNHTYTRSTLCIEHCFTDFKFKPLMEEDSYYYAARPSLVWSKTVMHINQREDRGRHQRDLIRNIVD